MIYDSDITIKTGAIDILFSNANKFNPDEHDCKILKLFFEFF